MISLPELGSVPQARSDLVGTADGMGAEATTSLAGVHSRESPLPTSCTSGPPTEAAEDVGKAGAVALELLCRARLSSRCGIAFYSAS